MASQRTENPRPSGRGAVNKTQKGQALQQCEAIKKNGERCKRNAPPGHRFCHKHNPAAGRTTFKPGPLNPNWKHGRYSKCMPSRLQEVYAESLADPELLAQREEIALLTARLSELLSTVDTGESGAIWRQLQEAVGAFKKANALKNKDEMQFYLSEIVALVERGDREHQRWQDIRDTVLDRNKVIASERRRLVEAEAYFTAEQGMAMLMKISESVKAHVKDPKARQAIANDIYQAMNFNRISPA